MRSILAAGTVTLALVACGGNGNNNDDTDGGNNGKPDACVGLQCQVVDCGAMGMPSTSISGTVFAPNGTLPLYGIQVYVPLGDPGPVPDTLTCDRCSSSLPGGAVAQATSGEDGTFRLENVPVGADIPLIITSGKWRRQITIPSVAQCTDTALGAAETRLPKNKSEGNIPKIAITTGNADTLECLARKLGIEDGELTSGGGSGRIHLYRGNGVSSFASGGTISSALPLWDDLDALKNYDIVFLSCEGQQQPSASQKTQRMLDNMKAYADAGGRVFASHWHNIWIGGNFTNNPSLAPAVWPSIGTNWGSQGQFSSGVDVIDTTNNPKGTIFRNWMQLVGGSPTAPGELPVTEFRITVDGVDAAKAEQWVYTKGGNGVPANKPQMFQFTTPNEVVADQRCGKVVFTDMHVSGTSPNGGNPFPNNCVGGANNLTMTPQEKALAFMFFDIASCVGGIF